MSAASTSTSARCRPPSRSRRRPGAVCGDLHRSLVRAVAGRGRGGASCRAEVRPARPACTYAKKLTADGITVKAVAPGRIETPMTAGSRPEVVAAAIATIPVGRISTPEGIGALVSSLTSEGRASSPAPPSTFTVEP
ncbi:SDR family oxidoreductase [Muricoccus radiodurans]|uniref:SDR family oxidoreductase n=1 Tax=Muricoccus radiodurans TaxID=2231721 RepID=UPI003CF8BC0F